MTIPTTGRERPAHSSVATPEQLAGQIRTAWREAGLNWKPTARWFPRTPAHLDEIFGLLFDADTGGHVDAILFADERRSSPLHNIRDFAGSLQSPLIDLKGRAGDFADAHFDLLEPRTWAETARRILKFQQNRETLAPQYRQTVDPEIQLLAQMYVSNKELRGMRYPLAPEAICYPGFCSAGKIVPLAENLALRGFLKKRFFDRLHECGTCQSRRLSVREECPFGRSARNAAYPSFSLRCGFAGRAIPSGYVARLPEMPAPVAQLRKRLRSARRSLHMQHLRGDFLRTRGWLRLPGLQRPHGRRGDPAGGSV
ncbi:hypothetical protein FHS76_002111 [Ochrobactrum daejeonense]|uniref:Thaumarchaeal output domain-containing protein n=1 Tax=Brucella daejeonensis TaxID=659015 RepID=A0A7W9AXB6_9HYPH|nr:hypothetical protein [Brucella daejeonensis]